MLKRINIFFIHLSHISIFFIIFIIQNNIYSVNINEEFINRAVKENQFFIKFLNMPMSNFARQDNQKQYEQAVIHDFKAKLWKLRRQWGFCFEELLKSQKILSKIYFDTIKNTYFIDTEQLVNRISPLVIQRNDKMGQHLLQFAYRNIEQAYQFLFKGKKINPFLHSQKIKYYINSIDTFRKAKKYALKALIEVYTPIEEKKDYIHVSINDYLNQEKNIPPVNYYKQVKMKLTILTQKKLLEQVFMDNNSILLHHDDNYQLVNELKTSLLEMIYKEIPSKDIQLKDRERALDKDLKNDNKQKEVEVINKKNEK